MEEAAKYKQAVRIYFPEKYYSNIYMTKTNELNPEELKDGDLIYFSFPWSSMDPIYPNNGYEFKANGVYLICSDYGLTLPDVINDTNKSKYYVYENNDDLLIFNSNQYKETNGNKNLKFYVIDNSKWKIMSKNINENFKFAYYNAIDNRTLNKMGQDNIITFTSEPQKYPD